MHKTPFPTTTISLYLTFYIVLLLAVSSLSPTVKRKRLIHSYAHLEGDVRWRRLFSATHYLLTIKRSGQVRGTRRFNSNSIFHVYSVNVGVVTMHSAGTGLYVAMDRKGKVYGASIFYMMATNSTTINRTSRNPLRTNLQHLVDTMKGAFIQSI